MNKQLLTIAATSFITGTVVPYLAHHGLNLTDDQQAVLSGLVISAVVSAAHYTHNFIVTRNANVNAK